ncbi:unnamed protein product [Boreogadus saida]
MVVEFPVRLNTACLKPGPVEAQWGIADHIIREAKPFYSFGMWNECSSPPDSEHMAELIPVNPSSRDVAGSLCMVCAVGAGEEVCRVTVSQAADVSSSIGVLKAEKVS